MLRIVGAMIAYAIEKWQDHQQLPGAGNVSKHLAARGLLATVAFKRPGPCLNPLQPSCSHVKESP